MSRQYCGLISIAQHENEKAMETIKRLQAETKETSRIMAEENAKLATQLIHYQRCGMSSGPLEATELSLQEALDREAQLKKLEVQLKKEIARLKDELFKVSINANPHPSQPSCRENRLGKHLLQ